jgi:phage tail protein X
MNEYIAKQGDTWDLISYNMYGSEYHITELILANYEYVDVLIFNGGEVLIIPELNDTDTSALPPWRR